MATANPLLLLSFLVLVNGCATTGAGARPAGASQTPTGSGLPSVTTESPLSVALSRYRVRAKTVEVSVNGVAGRFLLDTAAGLTHLTPGFAAKVACKQQGRLGGQRMTGERLDTPRCEGLRAELAGRTFPLPVVGILDLMSFYPPDAEPLDGLLGLDVFAGQTVTLDLGHDLLVVETPSSAARRVATMREGKARLSREVQGAALAVNAAVETPEGTVWFELDSGNGGTLLVSKPFASRFGLDPARPDQQPFRTKLVGGAEVDGLAFTPDLVLDGNLGMPFLAKQRITVDLVNGRIWFEPSGATPPPAFVPPPT